MDDFPEIQTEQDLQEYEWWVAGQPKAWRRQSRPLSAPAPKLCIRKAVHTETLAQAQGWADAQLHTPPTQRKHYAHTDANGTTCLLGECKLADAQRDAEEAAGGLVAYMMRR